MTLNAEYIARNWIKYGGVVLPRPGVNDVIVDAEEFMSVARALLVAVEALEMCYATGAVPRNLACKDALAKIRGDQDGAAVTEGDGAVPRNLACKDALATIRGETGRGFEMKPTNTIAEVIKAAAAQSAAYATHAAAYEAARPARAADAAAYDDFDKAVAKAAAAYDDVDKAVAKAAAAMPQGGKGDPNV